MGKQCKQDKNLINRSKIYTVSSLNTQIPKVLRQFLSCLLHFSPLRLHFWSSSSLHRCFHSQLNCVSCCPPAPPLSCRLRAPAGSALRTNCLLFCLSGCFSLGQGKAISRVCWPWSTSHAALRSQPCCLLWVLIKRENITLYCFSMWRKPYFPHFSHHIQLISTLLMLCTSDIYTLINYVGFINYLFYGVTVAGQIVLRIKEPDMYRPIKVKTQ